MFKEQNLIIEQKYKNPNKYIIHKNKYVRDFENLYKNIKDPWYQSKNFENDEQYIFLLSGLFNYFNKKKKCSILDIGAGDGIIKKYLNKNFKYTATDVHKNFKNVVYDDINHLNKSFVNKFDVIFFLKTVIYVADNINVVARNIKKYLKKNGVVIISYSLKKNSFNNKNLTDLKLRKILKKIKLKEVYSIEINRELFLNENKEKMSFFIFQNK